MENSIMERQTSNFRKLFLIASCCFILLFMLFGPLVIHLPVSDIMSSVIADGILILLTGLILHLEFFPLYARMRMTKETALILCAVFLVLYFYGQVAGSWIGTHIEADTFSNYQDAFKEDHLFVKILLLLAAAPISEELIFRGLFYRTFRLFMPPITALLLQSAIFALVHGTSVHLIPCFLLALFCQYIYIGTGKLKYAVLFHVAYNALTFIPIPVSQNSILVSLPVWSMMCLLVSGGLIYAFYKINTNSGSDGSVSDRMCTDADAAKHIQRRDSQKPES